MTHLHDSLIDRFNNVIREAKETYSKLPGVLKLEEDFWDANTIIVLIDSSKYLENSIPNNIKGCQILLIDVQKEIDYLEQLITAKWDVPISHTDQLKFFKSRQDSLKKLLKTFTS